MRRRILNIAALLSLLLCVATVVLWVRSYSRIDEVRGSLGRERVFGAWSDVGEFSIFCVRYLNYQIPHKFTGFEAGSFARDMDGIYRSARLLPYESIDVRDFMSSSTWRYHEGDAHIPFNDPQNPAMYRSLRLTMRFRTAGEGFLVLPVFLLLLRLLKLRQRNGCPTCGYNLTGNTSGVCPECGTAVVGKAGK